jgi:hypothetical protein
VTAPESKAHPESPVEDLQDSLEDAIESTAEPARDDEAGPADDKNAPAT